MEPRLEIAMHIMAGWATDPDAAIDHVLALEYADALLAEHERTRAKRERPPATPAPFGVAPPPAPAPDVADARSEEPYHVSVAEGRAAMALLQWITVTGGNVTLSSFGSFSAHHLKRRWTAPTAVSLCEMLGIALPTNDETPAPDGTG